MIQRFAVQNAFDTWLASASVCEGEAERIEENRKMLAELKSALDDVVVEGLQVEEQYEKILKMQLQVYIALGDEENTRMIGDRVRRCEEAKSRDWL